MRRFGASQADIDRVRAERGTTKGAQANEFDVWPENWALWSFWMKAQTQWHYAGGGLGPAVRMGMNYEGVRAVACIRGVSAQQLEEWADDLHLIELAVLAADRDLALKRKPNKRA